MGKAVLISIHPNWCELIAKGIKTVEVRKTKPKQPTPFKVLIYCTKDNADTMKSNVWKHNGYIMNGKVIGEFVCDYIHNFTEFNGIYYGEGSAVRGTCLSNSEIKMYGKGKPLYGWHISELVVYDKPKELSEFGLNRAPQSWCYVERRHKMTKATDYCRWCQKLNRKGELITDTDFTVYDDDFFKPVAPNAVKYCPFCGRKLYKERESNV